MSAIKLDAVVLVLEIIIILYSLHLKVYTLFVFLLIFYSNFFVFIRLLCVWIPITYVYLSNPSNRHLIRYLTKSY